MFRSIYAVLLSRWWLGSLALVLSSMGVAVAACSGSSSSASPGDAGSDVTQSDESSVGNDAGATSDASGNGCPAGRGPDMRSIPLLDGGTVCIDTTEVTNAQYATFLAATNGNVAGLPAYCSFNTSLQPGGTTTTFTGAQCAAHTDFDPTNRPNYPVTCVNYCDAYAFCSWAGKRLCGAVGGGWLPVQSAAGANLDASPGDSDWGIACTSGAKHPFPYGDHFVAGACANPFDLDAGAIMTDAGIRPAPRAVATSPSCQSPDPSYAGVFDLVGNASEWVDFQDSRGTPPQFVVPVGSGRYDAWAACWAPDGWLPEGFNDSSPELGFRCCADP